MIRIASIESTYNLHVAISYTSFASFQKIMYNNDNSLVAPTQNEQYRKHKFIEIYMYSYVCALHEPVYYIYVYGVCILIIIRIIIIIVI